MDIRPADFPLLYDATNTVTLLFDFGADVSGDTFVATLGPDTLSTAFESGDLRLTAPPTSPVRRGQDPFTLRRNGQKIMAGGWVAGTEGAPTIDDVVTVVVGEATVTVTVVGAANAGPGGGGAVDSVDGRTGVVTLDDLYEPIGGGGGAVDSVDGLTGAVDLSGNYDPIGAAAAAAAGAAAALTASEATTDANLTAHAGDGTGVHGITDTADLIVEGDTRLDDDRDPNPHAATHTDGGTDEITVAPAQLSGVLGDGQIPAGITRDAELTAAVAAAIANVVASAPGTLDTLDELAAALGDDPNFSATVTAAIAAKVSLSLYDANTILAANTDNTPLALTVAEQTFLGRITGGNIAALTPAQARTLLALGTAALVDTGTGSANAILGNDGRLTDARTPTAHNHAGADINSGTVAEARIDSTITRDTEALLQTLADAKGDIPVASAADTWIRKPVGTNRYPLIADSAATGGIDWSDLGMTTYTPEIRTGGNDAALSAAMNLGTTGTAFGRYVQLGKLLFVMAEINWGGTGMDTLAAAGPVVVTAPAGFTAMTATAAGDYHVGAGLVGQLFGIRDRPVTAYTLGGSTWTLRFVAGTTKTNGTATVASGASSVSVTHGLGTTPTRVSLTPSSSWATSGMGRYWHSAVGATTFTINATTAAAAVLTGNQTFDWLAYGEAVGILTANNPFGAGLGANGDHLHLWAMVPLA